jgi:hypothetical protein
MMQIYADTENGIIIFQMGCSDSYVDSGETVNNKKKPSHKYEFEVYATIKVGKLEKFKEYLTKKFDINYKMHAFMGRTAAHIAAEYGKFQILVYIIEQQANINALDNSGIPPLFLAMKEGHLEIVELLIEFGADMSITTAHGLKFHNYIKISISRESEALLRKHRYRLH